MALPLATALQARGLRVWFAPWQLNIGDPLLDRIEEGLSQSRFGVVLLSKNFFRKTWTKRELDGLTQNDRGRMILPVWHEVDYDFVRNHSLLLAGRVGIESSKGIEAVAKSIERAVGQSRQSDSERFFLFRNLPQFKIDQRKFRAVKRWWGAGDLPLKRETSLSPERLMTLTGLLDLEFDDLSFEAHEGLDNLSYKAYEELVQDRSTESADALLYAGLRSSWGATGLLEFGVPALPWLLSLLMNGDGAYLRSALSEPQAFGETTARECGTFIRCFGAIKQLGYLGQVKARLRDQLGDDPILQNLIRFTDSLPAGIGSSETLDFKMEKTRFPDEILQLVSAASLREALARWSFADRRLAMASTLSGEIFARLKTDLHSKVADETDEKSEAAWALAQDKSLPALEELFESAMHGGPGGSLMISHYGIPALPWILTIVLFGSMQVSGEILQAMIEDASTFDEYGLMLRFIAATKETGLWGRVERRWRMSAMTSEETGFFLLADSLRFPAPNRPSRSKAMAVSANRRSR